MNRLITGHRRGQARSSMAAAVAPAAMTASAMAARIRTGSASVAQAGKIPGMVAVMNVGGGRAPVRNARIRGGGLFSIVGATAFFAFDAEQEKKHRPKGDADEQNDFKGSFHRVDRNPSFAPINCGGQDECGEQI